VVRSVRQRDLLNAWLRALGKDRALPVLADYRPDRVDDELADMMGYDVDDSGDTARFIITQEGVPADRHLWQRARRAGASHQPLSRRRDRPGRAMPAWFRPISPCVAHRRPTYSDFDGCGTADGKDVVLRAAAAAVRQRRQGRTDRRLVQGRSASRAGFKVNNLMGLRSRAKPVTVHELQSSTSIWCAARRSPTPLTTSSN